MENAQRRRCSVFRSRRGPEVAATKFSSMLGFCGPLRAISSGVRLGLVWSEFFPSDADQFKILSC